MGAGKSTIGREVSRLVDRPFVDLDVEIEQTHGPIPALFDRGESVFREIEEEMLNRVLFGEPAVIALGGGTVLSSVSRTRLSERAFTAFIDVDVDEAWVRVCESNRPLAQDETAFRHLYQERRPIYEAAADSTVRKAEDIVLAGLGIVVERGALASLEDFIPGEGSVALIGDEHVLELHKVVLGRRLQSRHTVPAGEAAKSLRVVERLWEELTVDRESMIVALGGGATTDVGGFVAATYLRGISWVAVPTSLVGQVDAGIGGKTGINLGGGKNLVGAFHSPDRVIIDPSLLETLPEAERRAGLAEVVKTSLLAGQQLWRDDDDTLVRGCAAFKASVCIADPCESGQRAVLNLGHTFAHALEAGRGYGGITHGDAVALGLIAALRLSERHLGLDASVRREVEEVLRPVPIAADAEAAWAALLRDKKARDGVARLVLLEKPGKAVWGIELSSEEVRAELNALIAG